MLHAVFGAENMRALAEAIEAAGLKTTTYRAILEGIRRGQCPPENAVIVSIDDLSAQWIRPGIREMIQVFSDRGMVLVLGVVTQDPPKPAVWDYLRELEHQGHEVASHTMNHLDLPSLDERSLHIELSGSYEVLCDNLERCPVTLILPFGDMDPGDIVMGASTDYTFVAGILGGRSFAGGPPYYLGRIPPDTQDQSLTLRLLRNSYHP
jgi:peptidoglycan/xylan/chitin deacetylase (PgdA/CDA1 family)